MNMQLADWIIVFGLLTFLIIIVQHTKRYAGSVANFLVAGRCAGRYVIAIAEGFAGFGTIGAIAAFEMYYKSGFSIQWWYFINVVALLVITMSGWMIYRFRQTRALTIAQYLEKRYSRRFRIFCGIVAWLSGIINFGLFPAVGARFFMCFCNLPKTFHVAGIDISTFATVMASLLIISLYFILTGGQVALIVVEFFQGLFCNIAFIILIIALFGIFKWTTIIEALNMAPTGNSMLHPFHSSEIPDFNMWYYIIYSVTMLYGWMSWQGTQGYRAAAKTPHEARMAMILNNWRSITQQLAIIIIPICAYTFMHHPDFSAQAQVAKTAISNIAGSTAIETQTLQTQMTVPIAMSIFLKTGLMGIMCAVMFAAFISNHATYLHSWGSIFIQDVVMPFYKKPITPKQHINLLRLSILGVAIFIFSFGLLYRQNEYIFMFFAFTGTIFVGGAGAVVIGGLYWKRGTTAGAWCALTLGIILAFAGAIIRRIWPEFPINSLWVYFITAIACSSLYIIVSLLGKKQSDMNKMLHRGQYAVTDDIVDADKAPVRGIRALIAMGSEFTRLDKAIYISSVVWSLSFGLIFVIGTLLNWIFEITTASWAKFWWVYIIIHFALSILTTAWFIVGGFSDYKDMFRRLRSSKNNDLDNGRVIDK